MLPKKKNDAFDRSIILVPPCFFASFFFFFFFLVVVPLFVNGKSIIYSKMLIILNKPFKAIILRLNNINNISKSTFIIRAVTKRNQLITSKKKTIFAFWSSLFC